MDDVVSRVKARYWRNNTVQIEKTSGRWKFRDDHPKRLSFRASISARTCMFLAANSEILFSSGFSTVDFVIVSAVAGYTWANIPDQDLCYLNAYFL